MYFCRSSLTRFCFWFKRRQEKQTAQKNEAKKTFLPCSHFRSARETFSRTLGDHKSQGPPEQQKSFWISSKGFLWISMQVSHLRNRSCYLWCSQPPGTSLPFSVVCSCPLIFFKPWAGSAYLYCIHSPYVPCRPLKSPRYYLHLQVLGYQKWEVWPVCPLQAQIKHATDLLTAPLLKTPC